MSLMIPIVGMVVLSVLYCREIGCLSLCVYALAFFGGLFLIGRFIQSWMLINIWYYGFLAALFLHARLARYS